MKKPVIVDGNFGAYGMGAIVGISILPGERTYHLTVDLPNAGELTSFRFPLDEVVRLALEHAAPKEAA